MSQTIPQYRVLQGEVSQLRTEATHVQYLKNIKQQQELAGAVAGLQALTGQAGSVNSAQTAMDEGDPIVGFTMLVAGQAVHGSFWKTTFKDGDHVQVIGQESGGIFEAVAVAKPDERAIWMQPHCERGTRAQKRNLLKCSVWFAILGYVCAVLLGTFSDMPMWIMLVSFSIIVPGTLFLTVGMSWKDFMSFSGEMNAVGAALNLPAPENIDLFKSTKLARKSGKPDLPMGVYYY